MLHEVLVAYLEKVEQAILHCRNVYSMLSATLKKFSHRNE